jgi:hypothetical protein
MFVIRQFLGDFFQFDTEKKTKKNNIILLLAARYFWSE